MLKTILSLCLASLCFVTVAIPFSHSVRADTSAPAPLPALQSELTGPGDPPPVPVPAPQSVIAHDDQLVDRLLAVMLDWPPALPAVPAVPYRDVAEDIVIATAGNTNAQERYRDAVLLAGLGYWEGARYAEYVDQLRCNDPEWVKSAEGQRLTRWGNCDRHAGEAAGEAFTIWQIHPIIDRDAPLYGVCNQKVITQSRSDAAACALEIAHRSMKRTGSLSGYTGEWTGPHPLADERWNFAQRALKAHPFLADGKRAP
jgi:hypothetical protein